MTLTKNKFSKVAETRTMLAKVKNRNKQVKTLTNLIILRDFIICNIHVYNNFKALKERNQPSE